MRLNIVKITLIASLFCAFVFPQRGVRIAYADVQGILQESEGYRNAMGYLQENIESWREEIMQKEKELERYQAYLEAEKILLTPELIAERETEIKDMAGSLISLQNKRFGTQGDVVKQRAKTVQPYLAKINEIIRQVSEERKYDYVFDSSEQVMLYFNKKHDISALVKQRFALQEKRERRKKQIQKIKSKLNN